MLSCFFRRSPTLVPKFVTGLRSRFLGLPTPRLRSLLNPWTAPRTFSIADLVRVSEPGLLFPCPLFLCKVYLPSGGFRRPLSQLRLSVVAFSCAFPLLPPSSLLIPLNSISCVLSWMCGPPGCLNGCGRLCLCMWGEDCALDGLLWVNLPPTPSADPVDVSLTPGF